MCVFVIHHDCSSSHLEVLLIVHSQLEDSEYEVALYGKVTSENGSDLKTVVQIGHPVGHPTNTRDLVIHSGWEISSSLLLV